MSSYESSFVPRIVGKKEKTLIKEKEVLGYKDRIVIRAEEIAIDYLMGLELGSAAVRTELEMIQNKLKDKNFVGKYEADWKEKLRTTDNPERTEEDLAKGLALVLKGEISARQLPLRKAA